MLSQNHAMLSLRAIYIAIGNCGNFSSFFGMIAPAFGMG
jgi:hypothetical protein